VEIKCGKLQNNISQG